MDEGHHWRFYGPEVPRSLDTFHRQRLRYAPGSRGKRREKRVYPVLPLPAPEKENNNMTDFISDKAELGDESNDESFDEETGEPRRPSNGVNGKGNQFDDSSEEESDDDDEEAARAVRLNFIVDELEEPEEASDKRGRRKKEKRKRHDEDEAALDDEDLDLIGETNPEFAKKAPSKDKQFKRLKRGHQQEREGRQSQGVEGIFGSDEEEESTHDRTNGNGLTGEFDDFIEQDFPSDDDKERDQDDAEVTRAGRRTRKDAVGLDEAALDDMKEVFGDGGEYDWALALDQDEQEQNQDGGPLSKPIELKDVFEPSQLAERLLTDTDNLIRATDEPERFQLARAPHKDLLFTDEQIKEEATWISNSMLQRRQLGANFHEPFQKSVAKVLEFMTVDEFEPPFIFQHRKDHLIHADRVPLSPTPNDTDGPQYTIHAEKLLNQTDLWDIFDYDLKFRGLIEKRNALQKTHDNLVSFSGSQDPIFDEMLPLAVTMEELQDVQDYLHFQHSASLADIALANAPAEERTYKRPGGEKAQFEKIRSGKVYGLVRAFGITANDFAHNALVKSRRHYTEDPSGRPLDLANSPDVLDRHEYSSGAQCLRAAKGMFAEEIAMNPTMRKVMRIEYYMMGVIDCVRTEKGLRKIDDQHIYAEFKYLRNWTLPEIAKRSELFLKMCKAEEEGLVEIRVRTKKVDEFKTMLYSVLESDNFSEVAEAWNRFRREALDAALLKLDKIMARGVKENLRSECENQVAKLCREALLGKLDQAPYKPKGMMLGTVPRVLALSNGSGSYGRDAIVWAWVEEDGRVLENGKCTDLSLGDAERGTSDGPDVKTLCELVQRRSPDVIAVSGFSADTRKLYKQLEAIVDVHDLHGGEYEGDNGSPTSAKLEVIMVNDEVARLYQTSDRANMEHPGYAPLAKYCIGLAKYVQSPLKEYASLGGDITSISFDKGQSYVPREKLLKELESAMVDIVNLCGVNLNEAVKEPYTAALLPYVCGLGPRKASQLLKAININGGVVSSRADLVGDADQRKIAAVGPRVWNNCASFLMIEFDSSQPESEYLDNTRVHPEDYDIARKMAADALELDEEDIQAEQQENGPGAIVRKLIKDEAQEKVNDLILEEYAEQLEQQFNQRKRATLETIRAELQEPYEELRRNFALISTEETFIMITGETYESLREGMIVPMAIRRVQDDAIEGRLDCGVECHVQSGEISHRMDISPKQLFTAHQTVQCKIRSIHRKMLTAQASLLEEDLQHRYQKVYDWTAEEWDYDQERQDIEAMQVKHDVTGRTQRVIKHPLFRSFNCPQSEEYLGSQARGDCVIRPSSKGPDHLAVTWKVATGVYQHIDVLELDKENEFSVGRTLRIGGRFNYSDLDDLIVNHVKAMARKVDALMLHEKYKEGSKSEIDRWLTTYTEANPRRSSYVFCLDPKNPGYFHLCFKAGEKAPCGAWYVKVIPGAYELNKEKYPDMTSLCNGFKLMFQTMTAQHPGPRR